MDWWIFVPAAIGAALGAAIGRWIWRWALDAGWIVVVEFIGVIARGQAQVEEGPYKFTLEPNGGLRGNKTYAKRFWTERAAKVAAAHLTFYGIAQAESWRVKDVYVMRYRDFSMEGE